MSDGLSSDGPSSRRAGASYDVGKDDDELMAAGTTEGKICCFAKLCCSKLPCTHIPRQ